MPELLALLVEQRGKRQSDCPLVCFRIDRQGRAVGIGNFRKAWYAACERAALGRFELITELGGKQVFYPPRRGRSKPKPKMRYIGTIFHDLRRSAVRNLVRAGVPERVAQTVTGHRTRSVFERYNIVSPNDVTEAGRRLAEFHSAQKFGDISGTVSPVPPSSEPSVN